MRWAHIIVGLLVAASNMYCLVSRYPETAQVLCLILGIGAGLWIAVLASRVFRVEIEVEKIEEKGTKTDAG